MKAIRRIACAFLCAALCLALGTFALAAEKTVVFLGSEAGFSIDGDTTDLFESFKAMMPGDRKTETVTIKNSAKDCDFIRLYLRCEDHSETENPLSPSVAERGETIASSEDFLSQLTLSVSDGAALLYEGKASTLAGISQDGFLGELRWGESKTLTLVLSVPLTLSNEYANRAGEVDWVFTAEGFSESQLTVRKVWSDKNAKHAGESVTVVLLRDGEEAQREILSEENNWVHTFDRLEEGYEWTVEEKDVPDGYTVRYQTEGNVVTITNQKRSSGGGDDDDRGRGSLTVQKLWNDGGSKKRPEFVTVTLYDGETPYRTAKLSPETGWEYTWRNLPDGNWQVLETNIPKGYTPAYRKNGDTVVIENTALLQTGRTPRSVWLPAGAGGLLLLIAAVLWRKKRRE